MSAPRWVLRAIDEADSSRPLILLMRHAERGPLPSDSSGADVPLRPAGVLAARALGRAIGSRLASLHTSPVLRCIETSVALGVGAESPVKHELDTTLGDPGLFVSDPALAWTNWQRLGHAAVMAAMIRGDQLPGMGEPKDAAQRLVAHMIDVVGTASGVHAFITHDSVLAPVVAHTLGLDLPPSDWPLFLEALALAPGPADLAVCWRRQHERMCRSDHVAVPV